MSIKDIKIEYVIQMQDVFDILTLLEKLTQYMAENKITSIQGMELALILAFTKDQDFSIEYSG